MNAQLLLPSLHLLLRTGWGESEYDYQSSSASPYQSSSLVGTPLTCFADSFRRLNPSSATVTVPFTITLSVTAVFQNKTIRPNTESPGEISTQKCGWQKLHRIVKKNKPTPPPKERSLPGSRSCATPDNH